METTNIVLHVIQMPETLANGVGALLSYIGMAICLFAILWGFSKL